MKKSLLKEAMSIACSKVKLHPEYEFHMHYSFIIQNNKIIEWGTNNKSVPAAHYGYQARLDNKGFKPKMHSEVVAYRKARDLLKRDKAFDIINIRLSKQKEVRLSKPCCCCYNILKELGCFKFYYSSEVGFLTVK